MDNKIYKKSIDLNLLGDMCMVQITSYREVDLDKHKNFEDLVNHLVKILMDYRTSLKNNENI